MNIGQTPLASADVASRTPTQPRQSGLFARFARDAKGATAVEFAMVSVPFLMMLFGIIAVGLFYFTTFSLENAVEQAGRLVRTGQVNSANMTEEQFKTEVCSRTPKFVDCQNKLRVFVQAFGSDFSGITPASCKDASGALAGSGQFDAVAGDQVVLITACYEWELGGKLPYFNLGDLSNGSRLIAAATTFRTEPFDDDATN